MRIYVASSWRNSVQPEVVKVLREAGHQVYDFKHPGTGTGFQWTDIDPEWQDWGFSEYRTALSHPIAQAGFNRDFSAMRWADACVLVLPCNRSAHLEAGWMKGMGKLTLIYMSERQEPELMYKMCDGVYNDIGEIVERLKTPVSERKFYFGTDGKPGHRFIPLNYTGDLTEKELRFIDSDRWQSYVATHGPYIVRANLYGTQISVYAVLFSVDDDRPGCHTEFWWEGHHTREEMEEYIRNDAFLKRQFGNRFN